MLAYERSRRRRSFYHKLPKSLRVGITFLIVLLGWVFFRASNLSRAGDYLASMFGLNHVLPGAALVSGIVYQPYYLLSVAVAALVVWAGAQTWDWTQRLTLPKVGICFVLAWLALSALAAQGYNPFIYFIF
jgi:alginate O-acetyltransferase complex protein AlgI